MVSIIDRKNKGFGDYVYLFAGLSTDIKPKATNGSTFEEMDTNKIYFYNGDEDAWIGEADKFVDSIAVTTEPTKTTYKEGDRFDPTGMVITAHYTDSTQAIVDDYTYNPVTMELGTTEVRIRYLENGIAQYTTVEVTVEPATHELESISFTEGVFINEVNGHGFIDLSNSVVTAEYDGGSTKNVTADCTFDPEDGSEIDYGVCFVTATYTEDGVTKTTTYGAEFYPELSQIEFTHAPSSRSDIENEKYYLDLSNTVVSATYANNIVRDVTANCEFSPENGAEIDTGYNNITATYTENGITKTVTYVLQVGDR